MNVRLNHFTEYRWFAVVDDLVGGWAVSLWNKSVANHDWGAKEVPLFDSLTKEMAEYIVEMQNQRLFEDDMERNAK